MEKGNNEPKVKGSQKKKKKEKEYKKVIVVNDQDDWEILTQNLDKIAESKTPIAVDPKFMTESLFADIRQFNHFAQIKYKADAMSHMILQIMPEMKTMWDTVADGDGVFEEFDDGNTEDVEEMFEYPEDK